MKWAGSLIRITEHEIETLRRRMAEIGSRRAACEQQLAQLAAEAIAESARAKVDAEAGWYLVGFRQGWKIRKDRVMAELTEVEREEQGARDALNSAFEELKKVEQVAESARLVRVKEENRRETAALDELALRRNSPR